MAKLSVVKARKILHHGMVRGHKLTARQKRFMGARVSNSPVRMARKRR